MPVTAFVSYCLFILLTLSAAVHPLVVYLMCLAGMVVAFCELNMLVERHTIPTMFQRQPGLIIIQEMVQIVRVLSSTLIPILLTTFGGASFVVTMQMHALATDCSVRDLASLSQTNYMGFQCSNGFIGLDLQVGVPAWEDEPMMTDRRRLQATSGDSQGNRFGFVAPIFESLETYLAQSPPVAWAVKAGSPVRRSICDDDYGRMATCGFFADKLKESWKSFPVPPQYGQDWGFNITHFSKAEMLDAVEQVRRRNPTRNLGSDTPVFVVAESLRQYFGLAHPCLWVLGTLLTIGFIDRLTSVFDHVAHDEEDDDTAYNKIIVESRSPSRVAVVSDSQHFFAEVQSLWQDPLGETGKA